MKFWKWFLGVVAYIAVLAGFLQAMTHFSRWALRVETQYGVDTSVTYMACLGVACLALYPVAKLLYRKADEQKAREIAAAAVVPCPHCGVAHQPAPGVAGGQ